MADIQINDLLQEYETEIGRLNGEVIRQRTSFQAELREVRQLASNLEARLREAGLWEEDPEQNAAEQDGDSGSEPQLTAVPSAKPKKKPAARKRASSR